MVVRNSVDLIRVNLLHHLDLGLERLLVLDNGSTDGTTRELGALAQRLPIDVTVDPGPYRQAEMVTALTEDAGRRGADWVMPIDIDEFFARRRRLTSMPSVRSSARSTL